MSLVAGCARLIMLSTASLGSRCLIAGAGRSGGGLDGLMGAVISEAANVVGLRL